MLSRTPIASGNSKNEMRQKETDKVDEQNSEYMNTENRKKENLAQNK